MAKVFTITEGLENLGALKSGGQGSVYKARRSGEIITAIKILPTPISSETSDDKNFTSFQNEVQKLKKVNEFPSPNVVSIIASGITTSGNLPFIEMEYIEGPDLGELLKHPYDPVFTIKEIIKVADHLSNALAHCHRADVKHGDIKSNNVKFNQRTGNYILLDFGLSIMSDEQRRTSIRHAGAIEFMAPEQNAGTMLFETDIYSLGIILFELLAGTVPFPLHDKGEMARNAVMIAHMESEAPDLLTLRRHLIPAIWSENKKEREVQVPAWLIKMVGRCLEKEPAKRFANGMELHDFIHSGIIAEENKYADVVSEELTIAKTNELQLRKQIEKLELQAAEKDNLVEELQLKVDLKEKALYQFQYVQDYQVSKQKGISKSLFILVLLTAVGLAGFTAYHSFVKPHKDIPIETVKQEEQKSTGKQDSVFIPGNKFIKKTRNKLKRNIPSPVNKSSTEESDKLQSSSSAMLAVSNTIPAPQYNVINTAWFYDKPNARSRRNQYIAANGKITARDEKNDFVYVVVMDGDGNICKGWLSKKNLQALDN
ncbi:MAG: serine/threonine-protein kinase [Ferruginibacter sp.]